MEWNEQTPLANESDYPYIAQDEACQSSTHSGSAETNNVVEVQAQSVDALKAAIEVGPVSVTVEADTYVFQGYTGGILNSADCGTNLDHAITAVGWGTQDGQDYYIVRNSWGAGWGDQGYIMIAAVDGVGICGIQQVSVYPQMN